MRNIKTLINFQGVHLDVVASGKDGPITEGMVKRANENIGVALKAKEEIRKIEALITRVAGLNSAAGEIGPGMLAMIVADARDIMK